MDSTSRKATVVVALVCTSLVVGVEGKSKEEGGGLGEFLSTMIQNILIAFIATLVGYLFVFPFDFIRSRLRSRSGSSEIDAKDLIDSVPMVLQEMGSPSGIDFLLQKLLHSAPKIVLRLAAYGLVRGKGPVGLGKILFGASLAGLVSALYSMPFNTVRIENAIHEQRYGDLLEALKNKVSADGIASLYRGLAAAAPLAMLYHIMLFVLLEGLSESLKEKFAMPGLLSSALAVAGAAVLSSPLDDLRRVILNQPFDFKVFIFGVDEQGRLNETPEPDFRMLANYLVNVLYQWITSARFFVGGYVSIQSATVAFCIALSFHHSLLS